MPNNTIQDAVKGVMRYYSENPEKAISQDTVATAVVEDGLLCRVTGADGTQIVSDMPKGIGGGASAQTPGWLFRAALANCDATMIALRSAELGITLTTLEVTVSSTSDDRGLLQMDDTIPAGPLEVQVHVKIGAAGVPAEQLEQIIHWAEKHSPVGDAISRATPLHVTVQVQE